MSTNKYQIWIEAGGSKLCLPVNPEKLDIQLQGNNKTLTLAELGELTIPQTPKALRISFSSFLPVKNYSFSNYQLNVSKNLTLQDVEDYNGDGITNVRDLASAAKDGVGRVSSNVLKVMPHHYINTITNIMNSKTPCRFYIVGCDIAQMMTIESFSYSQNGGSVGEYEYTITLKNYREVAVRQVQVMNNRIVLPQKTDKRVSTMTKPKTYVVAAGDTIYTIAKKYYGDIMDYKIIYNANKSVIGNNPGRVAKGMVLTLP